MACSRKECATIYAIDNRIVYNIIDQFCNGTDLHSYVKQLKSNNDGTGALYAIQSRWLGPNHVNATTSEAEATLQTSTYDEEKNAWNWEKTNVYQCSYLLLTMVPSMSLMMLTLQLY